MNHSYATFNKLATVALTIAVIAGCSGGVISSKRERTDAGAAAPSAAQQEFQRGLAAMQAGQSAAAEQIFSRMAERYPDLSGPHANLGILHLQAGRPEQAEIHFRSAAKINPRSPATHNYLGIALRQQGKFEEAQRAYEQAIAVDASYVPAYRNLGILHDLYLGNLPMALNYYRKYQDLAPAEEKQVSAWIADLERRAQP